MSAEPLTRDERNAILGASSITEERYEATVQAEESGRKAAEERYRSAELSVVACKQRREEAEERKRAAEERADALRAEIAFARDYLGDLGHTDAFVRLHDALAADDDKRGAA